MRTGPGHGFALQSALALGAALVTFASTTTAQEPIRHVVKGHETCAAIAQRYYADSRLVDVLHQANPELGAKPPPHVLREGMVLVIPPRPRPASGPDAQLTTVKNQVEVLTPETKQGKPNDPLFRGNRVSTQAASAADVTFRDETQVKLGERTLVIILGDARAAASRVNETQTTLVTGNLRAFMSGARKDSAASVATDAANVRVFAGAAQVDHDVKKTTRLAVHAGSSTIEARGRTREVARGFGSKAELGKQPTVPRPLPAAPLWTALPADVLLVDGDSGAPPIVAEYDLPSPDPRVAEWHVQVARDEGFRDVIVDAKVPLATRRFEGQAPGPGHYFLRASAIDDDRFEGPFGRAAHVLVVSATVSIVRDGRRIEIEPADAPCMRVGNSRLTWVKGPIAVAADEPVRLRCAPSATAPTTLIRVDGTGP